MFFGEKSPAGQVRDVCWQFNTAGVVKIFCSDIFMAIWLFFRVAAAVYLFENFIKRDIVQDTPVHNTAFVFLGIDNIFAADRRTAKLEIQFSFFFVIIRQQLWLLWLGLAGTCAVFFGRGLEARVQDFQIQIRAAVGII